MGVELIQGFLLHRPSPASTILSQLEIDEAAVDPLLTIDVA
jgi:EAL domain-containing protein (putative c-di-GMP-specific phosphodiesterase class I)